MKVASSTHSVIAKISLACTVIAVVTSFLVSVIHFQVFSKGVFQPTRGWQEFSGGRLYQASIPGYFVTPRGTKISLRVTDAVESIGRNAIIFSTFLGGLSLILVLRHARRVRRDGGGGGSVAVFALFWSFALLTAGTAALYIVRNVSLNAQSPEELAEQARWVYAIHALVLVTVGFLSWYSISASRLVSGGEIAKK